jgi:hypothetical protein
VAEHVGGIRSAGFVTDIPKRRPHAPADHQRFAGAQCRQRFTAPPQPAEIAQARVFERLLRAECAELQGLAHRMAGDKYEQPEPDDSRPSGELTQIRARIDEVHGLLQALQRRFPHSMQDGDR